MTTKQLALLKQLITNERCYWQQRLEYLQNPRKTAYPDNRRLRGVEIGSINGVDPRTARSLDDMGLAEILAEEDNRSYIYLISVDPDEESR